MELIDYHSCSNVDPESVGYHTSAGYHTVGMPKLVKDGHTLKLDAAGMPQLVKPSWEPVSSKTECWSSDDCNKNTTEEAWFCNHDNDVFGFCEKCSTVWKQCWHEEFLCERGEKSCNESCKRKQVMHS